MKNGWMEIMFLILVLFLFLIAKMMLAIIFYPTMIKSHGWYIQATCPLYIFAINGELQPLLEDGWVVAVHQLIAKHWFNGIKKTIVLMLNE